MEKQNNVPLSLSSVVRHRLHYLTLFVHTRRSTFKIFHSTRHRFAGCCFGASELPLQEESNQRCTSFNMCGVFNVVKHPATCTAARVIARAATCRRGLDYVIMINFADVTQPHLYSIYRQYMHLVPSVRGTCTYVFFTGFT